eukprot:scaffold1557_cov246-Pinguiococcus_pyrenoidosus.AAC.17
MSACFYALWLVASDWRALLGGTLTLVGDEGQRLVFAVLPARPRIPGSSTSAAVGKTLSKSESRNAVSAPKAPARTRQASRDQCGVEARAACRTRGPGRPREARRLKGPPATSAPRRSAEAALPSSLRSAAFRGAVAASRASVSCGTPALRPSAVRGHR